MREMLDAAEEIWLNIIWLKTWDAISLVKGTSIAVNSPGEVRLPGVRRTPRRGKCQALGARRDELKQTVQYAESKKSAAGRQEWAQ